MKRVFFDSLVFLSGLLGSRDPYHRLFHFPEDRFELVLSDAMFTEVLDVLRRSTTFNRLLPSAADISLQEIFAHMQGEIPPLPASAKFSICQDDHDNKFLSSAIYLDCHYLVTEVPDLLALEQQEKWTSFKAKNSLPLEIVDVATFVAQFG